MSQNGCAHTATPAASWIQRDRLLDRRVRARDVAGHALDQVGRDERGDVRVALLREPLGVGGMREHGGGQVRAPDRLARRLARLDRRGVDLEAELAQPLRHRVGAALAVARGRRAGARPAARCGGRSRSRARAGPRSAPSTAEISVAGTTRTPCTAPGGERLVDAVDRVVVGQREQLHPGRGGVLDHLGGRQLAVGVERMRLEIEGRGGHGEPHIRGWARRECALCLVGGWRVAGALRSPPTTAR